MPAIRYQHHAVFPVVSSVPGRDPHAAVEIRTTVGKFERILFLGFICKPGIPHLHVMGRYAKMRAHEVTADDGFFRASWRRVAEHEYVLAFLVSCEKPNNPYGVYAVIDRTGCPIVMTDSGDHIGRRLKLVG